MTPRSVVLSKNKKGIQIEYTNDNYLLLSSSYLRAYSPSAENKNNLRNLDVGKLESVFNKVLIKKIESVGNYAIKIIFDDGHDTGIYSWKYLYNIGSKLQDS